jgi:hypothetical protein
MIARSYCNIRERLTARLFRISAANIGPNRFHQNRTVSWLMSVRTEIAPDLWDFNADPEELYLALLNLCRNSANARSSTAANRVACSKQ